MVNYEYNDKHSSAKINDPNCLAIELGSNWQKSN